MRRYVHEMVKALLVYEPEAVRDVIRRYYPSWRIFDGCRNIAVVRPELGVRRFADVVWVVEFQNRAGQTMRHVLVFEVKTGRFSEEWIEQLRKFDRQRHALCKTFGWVCWGQYQYIYICRKRYVDLVVEKARRVHGSVRAIPIEILLPLAIDRFSKAVELARKILRGEE